MTSSTVQDTRHNTRSTKRRHKLADLRGRWGFNQRIGAGITIIIALLMLYGGSSLFNLLSINGSNQRVGGTAVPALFVANEAQIKLLKLINLSTAAAAATEPDDIEQQTAAFRRYSRHFEGTLARLQHITRDDPDFQPKADLIAKRYGSYHADTLRMLNAKKAVIDADLAAREAADNLQFVMDDLGQVYADIQNYQPSAPEMRPYALDAAHAAAGVDMYLQNIGRLLETVRSATSVEELDNLQMDAAGELDNTTGQFEASVVGSLEKMEARQFIADARSHADTLRQEIMKEGNAVALKAHALEMLRTSRALADRSGASGRQAVAALDDLLSQAISVFHLLQSQLDNAVGIGLMSTGGFTAILLFLPILVFVAMLKAIQRKISDLASINLIGKRIADAKSVDDALEAMLEGLRQKFICTKGVIFLGSTEQIQDKSAHTAVCHNDEDRPLNDESTDHALIIQAAKALKPTSTLVICDKTPTGYAEGLQMAVPLIDEAQCAGVVYITGPSRQSTFTESHLELVSSLANTLVVTLKKIRMVEKTEEQNRQLRHMDQLKDDFLANTSHELRTPLNGIIGLAEASLHHKPATLDAQLRENLGMIVTSGRRLGALVNDILDFSKLRHEDIVLSQKTVDAGGLIDVVMTLSRPMLKGRSIELVNAVPSGIPAVWADENRVQQILHNLIGNAMKFTREGRVTVSAEVCDDYLRIAVTDTGIGIPADRIDSIFESFNQGDGSIQREFGGTGLGLSITRRLVELHGGRMDVISNPGEGSTFSFTLPVCTESNHHPVAATAVFRTEAVTTPANVVTEEALDMPAATTVSEPSSPTHWILVVDDEPINRQVLKAQLGSAGFGVIEAADGLEALSIVRSNDHQFDLVLLDVMMPKLSGFSTCQALREEFPAIMLPVIFLTAKSQTEDIVAGFSAGGNDYLVKPFSRDELLARIRIHLELISTHRIIQNHSKELEEKVSARTQQLVDMQQELVVRQKQAALGVLTAGVAHEINNPNNFVQVALQNTLAWKERFDTFISDLLDEDGDPDIRNAFSEQLQKLQDQLALIETGSRRIDNIVSGLRVITRLDEAERQEADVIDGLIQTVNMLRPTVGPKVLFDVAIGARPRLECWPAEINQVFMNVLMNAIRAIDDRPDGATGTVRVTTQESALRLDITISDEGVGMTPDVLERACDPFFTTREVGSGAGLGLSISRDIVQRHGGELRLESTPEVGTRVTIRLPVVSARSTSPEIATHAML